MHAHVKTKNSALGGAFVILISASFYLALTKATGAYSNGLVRAVFNNAYLSYVRFPCSACFAVGMGNVMTERNALAAVHTFCHFAHLLLQTNIA